MTETTSATPRSGRARARLTAVGGGVIGALLIWAIAVPIAGVDLQAPGGPGSTTLEPVYLPAVLISALVASLAGWGLLALAEKFTRKPRAIWTTIVLTLLLFSFGAPILGAGVPTGSRVTLAAMHLAVAAIVIPLLGRTATPK